MAGTPWRLESSFGPRRTWRSFPSAGACGFSLRLSWSQVSRLGTQERPLAPHRRSPYFRGGWHHLVGMTTDFGEVKGLTTSNSGNVCHLLSPKCTFWCLLLKETGSGGGARKLRSPGRANICACPFLFGGVPFVGSVSFRQTKGSPLLSEGSLKGQTHLALRAFAGGVPGTARGRAPCLTS